MGNRPEESSVRSDGIHRRVVAQLRPDLPTVDERLNVEAALRAGDDEIKPPHLGVGIQLRLALFGRGRPLNEGLSDLRLHVLAPGYGPQHEHGFEPQAAVFRRAVQAPEALLSRVFPLL